VICWHDVCEKSRDGRGACDMHCGRDDVQEKCDGAGEEGRLAERNRGGIVDVKCYRIDAEYVQREAGNGWD